MLDCSLTVPDPVQQMGSASTSKLAVTRTASDEPLVVLEVEVTHCAYIAIGNTENAIPERIKGYGQDILMTMLADSGAFPPNPPIGLRSSGRGLSPSLTRHP